jgi:flagellar biosynthesis anti-sigma factor FlgM
MRIGLTTPDPQSILAESAAKPSTAAAVRSASSPLGDATDLSSDTVTLSTLATQALGLPEVRQGQVDSLRQSVNSGQYQLDPHQIADAILNR